MIVVIIVIMIGSYSTIYKLNDDDILSNLIGLLISG